MPQQQQSFEEKAKKILVVEDDADLADSIAMYLRMEGYEATVAGSALKCYVEADGSHFDLAILDLSLPDQDGLVLARYLRSNTRTIVLILTARTTLDDRRMGYEAGAHMFVAKPIDFAELADSIAYLLGTASGAGRSEEQAEQSNDAGNWQLLRVEAELVSPAGDRTRLTTKEWDLLVLLSERYNEVVPHERLLKALGYPLDEYGRRSVESILYRLRKKMAGTGGIPLRTFHGNGYGFMAPLVVS